jgi:hypothetical protein
MDDVVAVSVTERLERVDHPGACGDHVDLPAGDAVGERPLPRRPDAA